MSPGQPPDGNNPVRKVVVPSLPSPPSESEAAAWFMENRSLPISGLFFDLVDRGLSLYVSDAEMLC